MDDDSGGDAHRGNPHGPALTVAECLRGALIGSIRRERLDHIIIANARGLRRVLDAYVAYYLKSWTHLSLSNAALVSRVVTPDDGEIVAIPHLCGLHHRYERCAA